MSNTLITNDPNQAWDLEISDSGDLMIDPLGDLRHIKGTINKARFFAQQAYIRVMTEVGDFQIYPELGANLQSLVGMPNTPDTAKRGEALIHQALEENIDLVFGETKINVTGVPTGHHSIRFDVYVVWGSRSEMLLSIEQDLTLVSTEGGLIITDDETMLGD